MYRTILSVLMCLILAPAIGCAATHEKNRSLYVAPKALTAPTIDGLANDEAWSAASWRPINQVWLGPQHSAEDFSGRYKVVWTESRVFLLVEIVDDILFDAHRDPLVQYWDDDCLEIFIDEDHSGGDHQYNHNAFAYHLSLDNRAIDIGTDQQPRDYTSHVDSRWRADGDKLVWEVSIAIYDDGYVDDSDENEPLQLAAGKTLGLMVAYCDNDGSELRENFVGSENVPSGPTDRGWIDAGLFGTLTLDGT